MGGLTITDVKIVGMCSKCRKKGDEIMKDKHGRIYRDDELSCVGCTLGKDNTQRKKDDEALVVNHLETRSSMEEDNTSKCKTKDVDNHVETDILLIRSFNNFLNKCVSEGMRNTKKIAELFRVREELRLA